MKDIKNFTASVFGLVFIFIGSVTLLGQTFGGGNGTQASPYQISTLAHLQSLASAVNSQLGWSQGKHFILTANITGMTTCIGISEQYSFQGKFNGNGKTIDVNIVSSSQGNLALFAYIDYATISNLTVTGTVNGGTNNYVSGVVGRSTVYTSTITGCVNRANITGGNNVGGIAASAVGTDINNCSNFGEIIGYDTVGGIVSICNNTPISFCVNNGKVTGHNCVGGIIGSNKIGTTGTVVNNSINLGEVSGSGTKAAGIAANDVPVTHCFNAGIIKGSMAAGIVVENETDYSINTGPVKKYNAYSTIASIGITSSSNYNAYSKNYYDKFISDVGGIFNVTYAMDIAGKAEGRNGNNDELYGYALDGQLGSGFWIFEYELYPRIGNSDASYVAAATLTFYDVGVAESINSIQRCFKLSTKHGVSWASTTNRVEIQGSRGVLLDYGEDTLIATRGSYSKKVPINITAIDNKYCSDEIPDSAYISLNVNDGIVGHVNWFNVDNGTIIDGSGASTVGDKIVLRALVKPGYTDCYRFACWTNEAGDTLKYHDEQLQKDIPRPAIDTLILLKDTSLIAHFKQDTFRLTLASRSTAKGIVNAVSGMYACKSVVTLRAIAKECYTFGRWVDKDSNTISTKDTDTITITKDTTIYAEFDPYQYTLTLTSHPAGAGNLKGAGAYDCGSKANVTASNTGCYRFKAWVYAATSDTISRSTNIDSILMTQDITLIAVFDGPELHLYSSPPGGGTVNDLTEFHSEYPCGQMVTAKATPNTGFIFKHWYDSSAHKVYNTSSTFSTPLYNKVSIYAVFEEIDTTKTYYTLTLKTLPDGIVIPTEGAGTYVADTTITINTTFADNCYNFVGWFNKSNNVVGSSPSLAIKLVRDSTLTAKYAKKEFSLAASVDPAYTQYGEVTGTANGLYECGYEANLKAESYVAPNTAVVFKKWTSNGDSISNKNPIKVTLNSDTNLVAHFDVTGIVYDEGSGIKTNFANNEWTFSITQAAQLNVAVNVYNVLGQKVVSLFNDNISGSFNKTFALGFLHSGAYYINLNLGGKNYYELVIIR